MSIGHDPIRGLFEPARELEPRDQEVTDALTLALSAPQRSSWRTRIVNIVGIVGAVLALVVTFAVVEVRGLGSPVHKTHHDDAQLIAAARRESSAIDAAALVHALQTLKSRTRRPDPSQSARRLRSARGIDHRFSDGRPARTHTQRRSPSRGSRCGCERRAMRPRPRSTAEMRSRVRG
jgi:hypothetical protein